MKLYCTQMEVPTVDKSGRLWKVSPLVLTFDFIDVNQSDLDAFTERITDEFCQRNGIDPYKISLK